MSPVAYNPLPADDIRDAAPSAEDGGSRWLERMEAACLISREERLIGGSMAREEYGGDE